MTIQSALRITCCFLLLVGSLSVAVSAFSGTGLFHGLFCKRFVPQFRYYFPGGADKSDIRFGNAISEIGIFRQKSVSGVDGIRISYLSRSQNLRYQEITLQAGRRTDTDVVVGKPDVQGIAIRLTVDGNGLNSKFPTCADDSEGDLPPVSNQNFLEHHLRHRSVASQTSGPTFPKHH